MFAGAASCSPQVNHEVAHGLITLGRVLLDRFLDDGAQRLRDGSRQRRRLRVDHFLQELEIGRAAERSVACEQLVEHDAEREDVAARVELATRGLLGRHVGDRAEHDAGTRRLRISRLARGLLGRFGETEVGELRVTALTHEDVRGLDVAMQDVGGVRSRERIRDADQKLDALPPAVDRAPTYQSCSVPPSTYSVTRYWRPSCSPAA